MKFKESPEIELEIGDRKLSIQQDNATIHVGTSVWPCALVLAKFVDRWSNPQTSPNPNPYSSLLNFQNKRAVELGAGCGPTSMALYLLGLTDIIVTDIPAVMPALKHNLKRNKRVLNNKMLKTAVCYWSNGDQITALGPPFDFVVVADVVYIEESVVSLVDAMSKLVSDDGVVLLGYQVRSPEADIKFWEVCGEVFVIEKIPHEDLHKDYAYEEADVYVFRKKKNKTTMTKE